MDQVSAATLSRVHAHERKLAAYQAITTHYRLDLQLFWQRANTYMLVQGALITFAGVVFGREGFPNAIRVIFSVFGVSLAAIWLLVLQSAVIWKGRWRLGAMKLDSELNEFRSYEAAEQLRAAPPRFLRGRHHPPRTVAFRDNGRGRLYSPESLTLFLPILFGLAWLALGIAAATGTGFHSDCS